MIDYKAGMYYIETDPLEIKKAEIRDVLKTPKGHVVMNPEYGSNIHLLVGLPVNASFKMQLYRETAAAIKKNVKYVKLKKVHIVDIEPGKIEIMVEFESFNVEVTI